MSLTTRFAQALAWLLPSGWAWPRDPGSVWMRLLGAQAGLLQEHDNVVQLATQEWLPQATRTRLAEWEQATGLPDPCFGALQSDDARRAALLARLRGHQGVYADSSPASLGAIAAFCAAVGVPATVVYNQAFRVGRNRVGQRLGSGGTGRLFVLIGSGNSGTPMRVGDRVGRRLVERPPAVAELQCALERVVPARFEINVVA